MTTAQFQFEYNGPETLFVDNNCQVVLDWGHPNTPTVTSTIGASIDSFYIFGISDNYLLGEVVGAGLNISVTYRVLDDQGNADFFTFDLETSDNISPNIIAIPINESNTCETIEDSLIARMGRWYNNQAGLLATDNCEDIIYVADKTLQETETEFNQSINDICGKLRSVTVLFSAEDQYGNQALDTFSAKFFTFDNTNPTVTQDPNALSIVCDENADSLLINWIGEMGGASVEDNCSESEDISWYFLWNDHQGGSGYEAVGDTPYILKASNYCDYSVDINFIAQDECGNKHAAFFTTFTLFDDSAPEFSSLPPDTTIDCSAQILYPNITAFDDCKGELEVLFSEMDNKGDNPDSCNFYNYTIIQSWEADDGCENLIQHSRVVTVIDTIKPDFDVPEDITIGCTETEDLNITGIPQNISDNCYDNLDITFEDEKNSGNCTYHIYRTWKLKDACGNEVSKTQDITVIDTIFPVVLHEPSNITLSCDDNLLFEDAFNQWLEEKGNAQISDNCNKIYSVAWTPGSYTPNNQSTYPGDPVVFDLPDTLFCSNDTVLYYKDVDFVFYDRCFNTVNFTRRFAMVDIIAPTVEVCPQDTVILLMQDECEVMVSMEMPKANDNCAGAIIEVSKYVIEPIVSAIQGSYTTPVNPVFLEIGPFNPSDNPVELIDLTLSFNNMDANDNSEYFLISGENGEVLDTTPIIDVECDDFEIQLADLIHIDQFKSWITDGYLSLTLVPNISPSFGELAINDICGGSSVSVDLKYTRENPNELRYIVSINDGEFLFSSDGENIETTLSSGNHKVEYTVLDCGNNTAICTQNINILDSQKPEIICPEDITVELPEDTCNVLIPLPLDFEISDNCENNFSIIRTIPEEEDNAFIGFNYNVDLDQFVANSKIFTFDNISMDKLLINPILEIKIFGDVDEADEFFEILSEDGAILGNTSSSNNNTIGGNCFDEAITTIKLDSSLVNKWANDGIISFTARPIVGANSINPCDATSVVSDGDNDGISRIYFNLSFEEYVVSYFITGATEKENIFFENNDIPHIIDFYGGESQVSYIVNDSSENKDTCQFKIEVIDIQKPIAVCEEFYVLFVEANGLTETVIDPQDIGSKSYDNCEIDSMLVIPNTFDCSKSGTNEDVKLFVWDKSSLMDSCTLNIKIEVEVLLPTYKSGVCLQDSLELFANLPDAPPGTWTIDWTGPQNFTSNLENPIRPNADVSYSGTYTVTVTGLNGCQTTGSIEVVIEDLSQPKLMTNNVKICSGEEIVIVTNAYSSDVKYFWYEGSFPVGTIVDSTTTPSIIIKPNTGNHFYYVLVKSSNCESLASTPLMVEVLAQPDAVVDESFVSLCEGEVFQLKTQSIATTYHWSGPNGFDSNLANPPAIENIGPINQGTYYLIINNDLCTDTTKVELVVFDKPMKPHIESSSRFCEGSIIVLNVNNITNADNYLWFYEGELFRSEVSNSLIIPDAKVENSGKWSVVVKSGNCYSDTSDIKIIEIEEAYDISATNNGPICEGDMILLSAPLILDATYKWTGPDGFESDKQNPELISSKSGEFLLEVITELSCTYYSSTYVEVNQRPRITALSNDAPDCLSGTECVKFFPSVFPNGVDFEYQWIGPNGFVSNDSIPEICDFDTSNNGVYQLVIADGFCSSEIRNTEIDANINPVTPILVADNVVCEGDSIKLSVTNNDYNIDDIFHWIIGGVEYKTKKPFFTIPKANVINTGEFVVYVEREGCESDESEIIEITVIPRPNQPFITGTQTICEGERIELNTPIVANATYKWSGPNNFQSDAQNPKIFPASLSYSGSYIVTVIVDGCESIQSEGFVVDVIKRPEIPIISKLDTAFCVNDENTSIKLCLDNIEANTDYSWYLNSSPPELITESNKLCINITDFTNFDDGQNTVFAIASRGECESDYSPTMSFTVNKPPDRDADAGADYFICNPDDAILQANPDPEGRWYSLNPDIYIGNPLKAKTDVYDVEYGYNYFIWSLSHGVCEDYSLDTASIYLEYTPEANDDEYITNYNTELEFYPKENDLNIKNTEIVVEGIGDIHGELIKNSDGSFSFIPVPSFIGTIELSYKIYKIECEENFDEAKIIIKVGEDDDCFGVNVITPNGDGINDFLIFPCLETDSYRENELIVFNQWGDQVFRKYNYKNDWQGTYNGKDLPVSTYYYVLFLDEKKDKVEKGFFVIER